MVYFGDFGEKTDFINGLYILVRGGWRISMDLV
jgi:hypothetical protein